MINSLLYEQSGARIGIRPSALPDGDYLVSSPHFDNCLIGPCLIDSGELTLASGRFAMPGYIGTQNSFLGMVYDGAARMVWDYDPHRQRLIVGQPSINTVSIYVSPAGGDDLLFRGPFDY